FGGVELTEGEFLATMKLVHYLFMEMKPSDNPEYAVESVLSSSSTSSFLMNSESGDSFGRDVGLLPPPISRNHTLDRYRSDVDVLKRMESLISSPRKSVDS